MTTQSCIKTEHTGAKNGGGYWGSREEAKTECRALRRAQDKAAARIEPEPAPLREGVDVRGVIRARRKARRERTAPKRAERLARLREFERRLAAGEWS